jgi:hypothetical protein
VGHRQWSKHKHTLLPVVKQGTLFGTLFSPVLNG